VEPVRVKLYGLVWTTRRRYLIQLVVAGLLMAGLLAAWLFHWLNLRDKVRAVESPSLGWVVALLDLTPWIVLVVAVLQGVEAFFVLRAFARQSTPPPTPPGASAPGAP
jgi:hypothetical protein